MGKKVKTGKSRRDKFYHLAKESGFRARSAFKLTQLNKKFGFLQSSKVIIDLCAAPGGWLQVASEASPVDSLIVGVDLVPIRPIPRVTTLQEDITTEKCRQALEKTLQTWQADVVLNDGAPNVGKSWVHDAFQQAELTLAALKLATKFLRRGGWFVTKVFRSKDYEKLLWVFNQLFRDVKSTKPAASRTESAEIFVVCKGYVAPGKLDPRFVDPKHVFKDVEDEPQQKIDLIHPEKKRRHRDGYAENDYTQHHVLPVTEFLSASDFQEKLAGSAEIALDDEEIANDPLTTSEIKECCKDIKVLGKKEIKSLLNWRKDLLKKFAKKAKALKKASSQEDSEEEEEEEDEDEEEEEEGEEGSSEDEEAELNEKLASLKEEERKTLKRKLRKVRKERAKLQHKMDTGMIIPGDKLDITDDINLFDLKRLNKRNLKNLEEVDMVALDAELPGPEVEGEEDEELPMKRKWMKLYDRDSKAHLDEQVYSEEEEEYEEEPDFADQEDMNFGEEEGKEEEEEEANPLLVDLETKEVKKQRNHNDWFSKDIFAGIDESADMENGHTHDKKTQKKKTMTEESSAAAEDEPMAEEADSGLEEQDTEDEKGEENSDDTDDSDEDDSDEDDSSSDDEDYQKMTQQEPEKEKKKTKGKGGDFEVVAAGERLGPEGLAIASKMVSSRKRKRDMLDDGYHRFMFDDEGLPDWFVQDEKRHTQRPLPVTKGDIEEYRLKTKAIDAQPIKKIAESKARKKHKALKKLERVRKKAEAINDSVDTGDKEKWHQIKQLYKKAGLLKNQKKDVTYVFAKRGTGKKVRRPQGVSGPFRVVDKRMKKDNMREKAQAKAARKGGKKKGGKKMGARQAGKKR